MFNNTHEFTWCPGKFHLQAAQNVLIYVFFIDSACPAFLKYALKQLISSN